jgi:hypothetical protein
LSLFWLVDWCGLIHAGMPVKIHSIRFLACSTVIELLICLHFPTASVDLQAPSDRGLGPNLRGLANVPLGDCGVGMAQEPADGQEF